MLIDYECELDRNTEFSGEVEFEVTNFGSRATRFYPGDPIEYEVLEAYGRVLKLDEEDGDWREATPAELEAVKDHAMRSSRADSLIVDQIVDMQDCRDDRDRYEY